VLVKVPRIASSELAERMLDSEASLGEKLMLIECMPAAAVELSNQSYSDSQNVQFDMFKK